MADSVNPTGLKFGIFLPPVSPWPVLRERVRLVEQLGFESLWMGDKFASPGDPYVPWFECWALLPGFAACTERVSAYVEHIRQKGDPHTDGENRPT